MLLVGYTFESMSEKPEATIGKILSDLPHDESGTSKMTDQQTPISTIPERLSALLTDWGTEFSMFLKELEEMRALVQELEAEASSESNKVEALNKRIEAQDTLIESMKVEAEKSVTLRREIDAKDQELEKKNIEIGSKQELITGLERDADGIERLKGDGRVKDHEIARLTKEKQHAEQDVAELKDEFKIFTASTLTGVDAMAELEAVRAELDARRSLIESLRGDAQRAQSLEVQLEEKRNVISELEAYIDRHVNTLADLKESVATWKGKYAAPTATDLTKLLAEEPQPLESVEDISADYADGTVAIDMSKALFEAQKVARSPGGLSSEPRSAVNRASRKGANS